jgi:hypothetical protein
MQDAILTVFGAYLAIEMLTGGLIAILISKACKSDKPESHQERHVSWRVGALIFLIAIGAAVTISAGINHWSGNGGRN